MFRIGQARDIHRLEDNGRPFVLGGVNIPFSKGPVSHSDGDVLYHAISEALLGSLAKGDLGTFFPDTDDKYKNMDSSFILKSCYEMIKKEGYHIVNLDTNIICERPKLGKYLLKIRENIAELLDLDIDRVSVKAQTNEKCGEIGLELAIEATCVVLIEK